MRKKYLINALTITLMYLLINVFMLYNMQNIVDYNYYKDYIFLMIIYNLIAIILFITYLKNHIDMFEPIVLVSVLYIMIFCITPMINIVNGDTLCLGIDVMDGLPKATLIFFISYLYFYSGYYLNSKIKIKKIHIDINDTKNRNKKYVSNVAITIWILCYICTIIHMMATGKGLMYIITGGIIGNINSDATSVTSIEFLSMFSYSMIPAWMYIYIYSNNDKLKVLLWILTLTSYMVRGFRFIIVILVFAPIIYTYIKNNKRPNLLICMVILLISIFAVGIIGFVRDSIRFGTEINWNDFNLEFILDAIKENFNIYMPFYGLVESIPKEHGYTLGRQFIYTFTMFIPRIIWPEKPQPIVKDLIGISISEQAVKSGLAWPNLGEFYSEFGIIGTIICMFIFGSVLGLSKRLYQGKNRDNDSLIAYSIILPSCLQLITRGYTPSNFYLVIFLLMPIRIIKILERHKERIKNEQFK